MFILDILFVPLGLFMAISPPKFYEFTKRFKPDNKLEVADGLYLKHIRQIGIGFFILGVICTILTFKYGL
ncbi:hypothetical protein IMX26_15710 [Clostridium sp. 'deep sea']|uniref:hypothetical protein n=1 Tax=Clostridium sp. 'deep sea' TaxID=2779445 RepID=UPI001896A41E|nr:hypothetical protein [Clostridium sp. 'deep sea']QOR34887.1 hypothetical protein IMX26_15710 [Clostridium sp. 'deep sea']